MTLDEPDIGGEVFGKPSDQQRRATDDPKLPEGHEEPHLDSETSTDWDDPQVDAETLPPYPSNTSEASTDKAAIVQPAIVATHERRPWNSLIGRSLLNPELRSAIASGEAFDHLLFRPNKGESIGVRQLPEKQQREHQLIKFSSNASGGESDPSATATQAASPGPPVANSTAQEKLYTADELAQLHSSGDVERLLIEVEVSLSNAERIAGIAVEQAKIEFKKLAAAATAKVEDQFQQFRADLRVMWGRR